MTDVNICTGRRRVTEVVRNVLATAEIDLEYIRQLPSDELEPYLTTKGIVGRTFHIELYLAETHPKLIKILDEESDTHRRAVVARVAETKFLYTKEGEAWIRLRAADRTSSRKEALLRLESNWVQAKEYVKELYNTDTRVVGLSLFPVLGSDLVLRSVVAQVPGRVRDELFFVH